MSADPDSDLQRLIDCLKGDASAREFALPELLELVAYERLRRLAAAMLNQHWPRLKRLPDCQTTNVVNKLLKRLEKALEAVDLRDEEHLFNLAYKHTRYILLDWRALQRNAYCCGRSHVPSSASPPNVPVKSSFVAKPDWSQMDPPVPPTPPTPPTPWLRLLEEIDKLSEKQYEVVILIFWWGMTQQQVADYWDCHLNTVTYHWVQARRTLRKALGADANSLGGLWRGISADGRPS